MAKSRIRLLRLRVSVAISLKFVACRSSRSASCRSAGAVLDGAPAAFARDSASRKRTTTSVALAGDAGVANVLVAHQGAQVAGGGVEALGQRARHVHLEQEVHAAAQVEAEVHRQRADRGQPGSARPTAGSAPPRRTDSEASGLKACSMTSLARSWVSVSW
jgi:hypothetical protein